MHELAICQEMLSLVSRIAAERGATRIDRIVVIIGPLSGIEIPLLQRAFSVARAGTPAANAALESEICGVRVRCRKCGATSGASVNKLTCGRCGNWRVDVQQGDEMLLKTVELSGLADGAGQQVPATQPPTVH
jgi:hydrogenase nickel incorporation protein HypA/HybF